MTDKSVVNKQQIVNCGNRREFQTRGTEHMQAPVHILDAPKIDENEYSELVTFIDKNIKCALPDETKYPEMNNLVKKVQTHHHTTTCRKKMSIACRFKVYLIYKFIFCNRLTLDL